MGHYYYYFIPPPPPHHHQTWPVLFYSREAFIFFNLYVNASAAGQSTLVVGTQWILPGSVNSLRITAHQNQKFKKRSYRSVNRRKLNTDSR